MKEVEKNSIFFFFGFSESLSIKKFFVGVSLWDSVMWRDCSVSFGGQFYPGDKETLDCCILGRATKILKRAT